MTVIYLAAADGDLDACERLAAAVWSVPTEIRFFRPGGRSPVQMRSAAHIKTQIERDIRAADATVALVGSTTTQSSRVSFEIRTARAAGHAVVGLQSPDADPAAPWPGMPLLPWSIEGLEAWLARTGDRWGRRTG